MYNCRHFQLVINQVLFFAIVTDEGVLPPSENMSRSLTAGVIVFFFLWFSTCCQKFYPTLPHPVFIRPRSDHSLPMSVTNSLTDWLTNLLNVEDLMNWPKYADYADYDDHADYADYADYVKYVEYAEYA